MIEFFVESQIFFGFSSVSVVARAAAAARRFVLPRIHCLFNCLEFVAYAGKDTKNSSTFADIVGRQLTRSRSVENRQC